MRARIRVKVQADKLQLAPPDIVYRGIVDQQKEQLLKEFKLMSFTAAGPHCGPSIRWRRGECSDDLSFEAEVSRRHYEWQLLDHRRTALRRGCPRGFNVLVIPIRTCAYSFMVIHP